MIQSLKNHDQDELRKNLRLPNLNQYRSYSSLTFLSVQANRYFYQDFDYWMNMKCKGTDSTLAKRSYEAGNRIAEDVEDFTQRNRRRRRWR